jgi:type IV pilus assembly protein PilX
MAPLNRHLQKFSVVAFRKQRGYLMVVSLLIILLITVMSISMAKSFFQEEGMAGNLREKSRSFAAAQAGLRYAESIAIANGKSAGGTCLASGSLTASSICNNAYTKSATNGGAPLQASWVMPTPVIAGLTFSNSPSGDSFYSTPGIYIQWLGPLSINGGAVYRVTSFGYGGTQNSVSMVESILQVTSPNKSVASGT